VLRVRARLSDVVRKAPVGDMLAEIKPVPVKTGSISIPTVDSPGVELDIRGQRVEDAVESLQRYLERAYLAGLPYVRIIHGKGTGKLRQAIRDIIKQSPHVSRWESGGETEGGDGVTVAMLRSG
jgi:DNA mismatch repair protein MutS2